MNIYFLDTHGYTAVVIAESEEQVEEIGKNNQQFMDRADHERAQTHPYLNVTLLGKARDGLSKRVIMESTLLDSLF